jgi:hypothetical protein
MSGELLDAGDRARLREFAVSAELSRPHLLPAGAAMADQFRQLVPALGDEAIAAVTALTAVTVGARARAAGCGHLYEMALLLQAVAVDLAHLEFDRPEVP